MSFMIGYPEPPVEPPEADYYTASGCKHEIYEDNDGYEYAEHIYCCVDCLRDAIKEWVDEASADELMDVLDVQIKKWGA